MRSFIFNKNIKINALDHLTAENCTITSKRRDPFIEQVMLFVGIAAGFAIGVCLGIVAGAHL